jgi:hypothetical protein
MNWAKFPSRALAFVVLGMAGCGSSAGPDGASELGLEIETMRRVVGRKAYGVSPMNAEVVAEPQRVAVIRPRSRPWPTRSSPTSWARQARRIHRIP